MTCSWSFFDDLWATGSRLTVVWPGGRPTSRDTLVVARFFLPVANVAVVARFFTFGGGPPGTATMSATTAGARLSAGNDCDSATSMRCCMRWLLRLLDRRRLRFRTCFLQRFLSFIDFCGAFFNESLATVFCWVAGLPGGCPESRNAFAACLFLCGG